MLILFLFRLHFLLSSCSKMLNLENILEYIPQKLKKRAHFKISSPDEVLTRLFSFFFHLRMKFHPCFSSWDENSSRQKRVNSKRHFTIDTDDFIPGQASSADEISRVNTLLVFLLEIFDCAIYNQLLLNYSAIIFNSEITSVSRKISQWRLTMFYIFSYFVWIRLCGVLCNL